MGIELEKLEYFQSKSSSLFYRFVKCLLDEFRWLGWWYKCSKAVEHAFLTDENIHLGKWIVPVRKHHCVFNVWTWRNNKSTTQRPLYGTNGLPKGRAIVTCANSSSSSSFSITSSSSSWCTCRCRMDAAINAWPSYKVKIFQV